MPDSERPEKWWGLRSKNPSDTKHPFWKTCQTRISKLLSNSDTVRRVTQFSFRPVPYDSPNPALMTNSTCPSCGQALASGSRFCGHCGATINFQPSSQPIVGQSAYSNSPFRETNYIVDQKILAIRDTFSIKNTSGQILAYVKQQLLSFGPKFWFEGTDGSRLGEIHGKVLAIRPTFEIFNSQDQLQATIKKKILKLLGSEWWMENQSGQEIAKVHGNIMEHDYSVQSTDGSMIAQIHKKWVSVRDSYCIEIQNPTLDPYLVVAYAISMDHTEKKEDKHHSGLSPF